MMPEPMQAKSTGQLSPATYTANFLGCLARIFTSYKEGGGASMIRGYILGTALFRTWLWGAWSAGLVEGM